ncbi:MAG: flagellar biosynthesis anti-sigma factor FlgM [Rhodoferax sp.]|nr:flagellar biosynthesis anti-sigma factor FlgM [Rhodoferax sp.]
MKIGQTPELPVPGTPAAPKKATQEQKAAPTSVAQEGVRASTAGASVSVSTLARSLETADRSVGGDFDNVKVDAIRTAIKEGTYKVNPEAIADKLLSNASEMLNVTRGY